MISAKAKKFTTVHICMVFSQLAIWLALSLGHLFGIVKVAKWQNQSYSCEDTMHICTIVNFLALADITVFGHLYDYCCFLLASHFFTARLFLFSISLLFVNTDASKQQRSPDKKLWIWGLILFDMIKEEQVKMFIKVNKISTVIMYDYVLPSSFRCQMNCCTIHFYKQDNVIVL